MTDRVDDGGWLHVSRGSDDMYILFVKAEWSYVRNPKVKHYEGLDGGLRYDLQKKWLEIIIKQIFLPSYTSYKEFAQYMNEWQDSGDISVEIYKDTSKNPIEMKGDGNGTEFSMVMPEGIKGAMKLSPEDGTVYMIKQLRLTE